MEEKSPFWKSAMTYGLYLGLAVVLYSVVLYVLGQNMNPALTWISFVILAAGVYLSQLNYRNRVMNGFLSYSSALWLGVAVMLFSGIFQTVYTIVIYKLDPSQLDQIRIMQEEAMLQRGMSEEDIETASEMMNAIQSPAVLAISGLISFVILGFIISLITSIFVKKTDDGSAFDEAMKEVQDEQKINEKE
jgi:hypothetical protein